MDRPMLIYPSGAVIVDKDDVEQQEAAPLFSRHEEDRLPPPAWWREPSSSSTTTSSTSNSAALTVAIIVIVLVQFQGPIKRWLNRVCCRILVDSNGMVVPWQDLFWMILDGLRGRTQAFLEYTRQQLHKDWMHHMVASHAPPDDDDEIGDDDYECDDRVRAANRMATSKSGVLFPIERRKRGDSLPALEDVVGVAAEQQDGVLQERKKHPPRKRRNHGNGVRRWNDEELEPAFLDESDYPPGWMVYHPVLGVVQKAVADQYNREGPLKEEKEALVSDETAPTAVDGHEDENSFLGFPESASSAHSTPPPSTLVASG